MTDTQQGQQFQTADGSVQLQVGLEQDTVWLTQAQVIVVFERGQSVISRHINNSFKDGELKKESNMQKIHIAHSDKPISLFSLDVIKSVGYRVKSQRGVQFRQWASDTLKQNLVQGYATNQKRLAELGKGYGLVRLFVSATFAHTEKRSTSEKSSAVAVQTKQKWLVSHA